MGVNILDAAGATFLPTGPVRWEIGSTTPQYVDEGDLVNIRIRVYNPVAGATVEIEITGALAGDADWTQTFEKAAAAACLARGATYERITASKGRITLGPGYDELPIDITRRAALDLRTEGLQQLDVFLRNAVPGLIKRGVMSRWVRDTSFTPPGTPSLRHTSLTPGTGIDEGQSFTNRIQAENFSPDWTMRVFSVNTANGQADWTTAFRPTIRAAFEAAGWQVSEQINPYAGSDGFAWPGTGGVNGIIVRYRPGAGEIIDYTRTALADGLTEDAQEQVDFIIDQISAPEIVAFSTTVSKWVRDTSQSPTPSYWQIKVTPPRPMPGDVVTYTLFSETGVSASSVAIAAIGNAGDAAFTTGFHAALQAAADADPHVTYDGAGTIAVDATWGGTFSWSRQIAPAFEGTALHGVRLSAASGTSRVVVADAVALLGGVTLPATPAFLTGVNLSGGEHGSGTTIPGTYGVDYRYPARPEFNQPPAGWDIDDYRHQELFYWWQKGAGIIRLPVRWERIQRVPFGPLYDGGFAGVWNGSDSFDMARIDDIIRYAVKRGMRVIVDIHNYGRLRLPGVSNDLITPTTSPSPEAYYDLLRKLATRYLALQDWVQIDVMNEPAHGLAKEWARLARGAVQAIRSTGFMGRVLVPGIASSGGWSWLSSGNADALASVVDPANNMDFTPHQYLNPDRSGAGSDAGTCTISSGYLLRGMIAWCREAPGERFIQLGEFGVSDPAVAGQEQCAIELPNMMQLLNTSRDVVHGWTAWVGGSRVAATDHFFLGPQNTLNPIDTPQAKVLMPWFDNGGDGS